MGVAAVMDASGLLAEGVPANWGVYWGVDDVDAAAATAKQLGGSVIQEPETTPYGRLATVADTAGATLKLRSMG